MLRKPRSLVEGQALVGTTFEKHFTSSPGATGDWYKGAIAEVKDRLRGTAKEGGKLFKGLFFDVRFASQSYSSGPNLAQDQNFLLQFNKILRSSAAWVLPIWLSGCPCCACHARARLNPLTGNLSDVVEGPWKWY